jgi:transglutaminase-like putative cysteine protease
MRRGVWLLLPLLVVAASEPAIAQRASAGPVLHERIPPDPREDVALQVSLDGDLPAAINTPHGLVAAPDPAKPVGAGDSPYTPNGRKEVPDQQFHPDRDTQRPDGLSYDDPFSPSTAPFKRMSAFDAIDASYTLSVRDGHTVGMPVSTIAPVEPSDELFYADMVVDLAASTKVRIPSVGPGARVLRARAGVGTQDVRIDLFKDGAENWFVESDVSTKARLVMEIAAPRAAFGGDFGNPSWAELESVPPLPPNVEKSATLVSAHIGVSRQLSPRDDVTKLVAYYRGFTDSNEPPAPSRDIYLDLALSRKGVCRHRAFAFMVTALHLGIPTRMVLNEAHAWVEVHDGRLWRRIDLGGAGLMPHDPQSQNVPYDPPPDPFAWPQGATRGEDAAERARRPPPATPPSAPSAAPSASASSAAFDANGPPNGNGGGPNGNGNGNGKDGFGSSGASTRSGVPDERPTSLVTLALGGGEAHRGAPLRVHGTVAADSDGCAHVSVEIFLRSRQAGDVPIGVVATDDKGAYDGAIVLPSTLPLGDYDVAARTFGDARCGRGVTR